MCLLRGAVGADQPVRRGVVFLHNRSHSCPFCVCHVEGSVVVVLCNMCIRVFWGSILTMHCAFFVGARYSIAEFSLIVNGIIFKSATDL